MRGPFLSPWRSVGSTRGNKVLMSSDERNVDEQLDEEQDAHDAREGRSLIQNHRNNARTNAEESSAIAGAFGAIGGTTVTNPGKGTDGQTVTGEQP